MRNEKLVRVNKLFRKREARTMWFRPEMSSIFYVESNYETIKAVTNEVNDLFMLKQLMTF